MSTQRGCWGKSVYLASDMRYGGEHDMAVIARRGEGKGVQKIFHEGLERLCVARVGVHNIHTNEWGMRGLRNEIGTIRDIV